MTKFKQHISIVLLTIFVLIKLAGLHELTHSDNQQDNDCEICEYVVSSNKTPFVANEQFVFKQPVLHNYDKQLFYEYSYQFVQNQIDNNLFSRPPPQA